MTFNELERIFNDEQNKLTMKVHAFPWDNESAYMEFLANSYEYAFNSTRILALAGGLMPGHLTRFSNRFITHAAEEKGHEKLLEKDVAALGGNIKTIKPVHEMRLFHQSLYYWLSPMGSPLGIFGFVLALEGVAVNNGPWIYNRLHKTYGQRGTTFVKIHSAEDPDHLEKALSSIKNLSPEDMAVVAESTIEYCQQYGQFLEALGRKHLSQKAA